MSLRIAQNLQAVMLAHAEAGMPDEICGFMIGHDNAGGRQVVRVVPAKNAWPDAAEKPHRFAINPLEQMQLERTLPPGESLVGYYHSHPTAAAVPSRFDRDVAWPFYSSVIVSLVAPVSLRGWRLTSDDGDFAEEAVEPTPALR